MPDKRPHWLTSVEEVSVRLGRIKIGRTLLVGAAIIAVAIGIVWSQRRPIAAGAIDRALARQGVQASYEIKDIGFRTQRIEKLRLGDPTNPDLTADWAEVSLAPTWDGVTVTAIKASGVHLRGRVVGGQVSWGVVDKLLPAPTGKPLTLPDIDLRLADTRVTLATGMGVFTADVAGSGLLADGFKGQVKVTAPFAGRDGCRIGSPVAIAQVAITRRRLHLAGVLNTPPSTCASVSTGPVQARFDVTLNEAFDRWDGNADVRTPGLRQGALQLAGAAGQFEFAGTLHDTQGTFAVTSPAARYAGTRVMGLSANGKFAAGKATKATGRVKVERALADPAQLAAVRRAFVGAVGTPVGPLAEALSQAVAGAGEGAAVDAAFTYQNASARLSDVRVAARGGGALTFEGGAIAIDAAGLSADGNLTLSGGGFPSVRGRLTRTADGSTRGLFAVAPYRAKNAELMLAPVRFATRSDGTLRIETVATIDGPVGDGRAEGVRVPVIIQRALSGDIVAAPGCTPVAYRRIAIGGTVLAPGSITLCPTQGGAIVRSTQGGVRGGARTGPLRLTGRIGDQPLALAAASASFTLGGPVSLSDFTALLGAADRRTQLKIARLDGVARVKGLAGRYTGLSGSIARVPFLASVGQGDWAFSGGVLDAGGKMMLADSAAEPRFYPLAVQGAKLRLKDGRVTASATLFEPKSARALTTVALSHDLSRGIGEARLVVDALIFGKSLQPEAITPLTERLIADVYGQIDGTGIVRWTGDKVTSSGKFRTDAVDFNAAIGPVTAVSGEIEFDDLIALSTPPGQQVRLPLVNPGVEVKDGVITYRLRPNQIVEVERGRWPFAGGELLLEPATLDFGQTKPRNLSFRVVGLDAAKFIDQLKLQDISATGVFDGVLPISFKAAGGRIVGGRIVARAGGGTLAYVGDVSNAQTNMMTQLAFDALKSIRYSNLFIDLDGDLDGEIVSKLGFTGTNQSPAKPTGLLRSFTGLPFKFNITVRAPFRTLANVARAAQNPASLAPPPVQPPAMVPRP